jgi:preprotein translocase subunit SecF
MEFFRTTPTIDWMGKKWLLIGISVVLSGIGVAGLIARGGPNYGIDFKGGTVVQVKFREAPPLDRIRTALSRQGLGGSTLQRYGAEANNEIMVGLDLEATSEADLGAGRRAIVQALGQEFGGADKPNFQEVGPQSVGEQLASSDALRAGGATEEQLRELAQRIVDFRDSPPNNGMIAGFADLRQVPGVTAEVQQVLEQAFSLPPYAVRNADLVGPRVGAALRRQALNATLLALASMLVYIAFRFEWIYGVGAVLANLNGVVMTVGITSLIGSEISLTVVAALLTLVGYSINDTIVVFDRIRENVRLMRRESMTRIATLSINQTLSRTILTGGLTWVSVIILYFLGGEVLRGFALTLVIGIPVGTYSSIAIGSPLVVSWLEYAARHRRGGAEAPVLDREKGKPRRSREGARAKA